MSVPRVAVPSTSLDPVWCTVPAGPFLMGCGTNDSNGSADEKPQHSLSLPAFSMARDLVTNAGWALFMQGDGYNVDSSWWDSAGRAWLARNDAAAADLQNWRRRTRKDQPKYWDDPTFGKHQPDHPVVGVTWYEASAYARWMSLQLGYSVVVPSEAEWEKAARGTDGRIFPWGDVWDRAKANGEKRFRGTTPVGMHPDGASPSGALDMVGNVWVWTRSVYRRYPYLPNDGREDNEFPAQQRFTLRGGGWANRWTYLRSSRRLRRLPDLSSLRLGVRLVRHG